MNAATALQRRPRVPQSEQLARLRELDFLSRTRCLRECEVVELDRLLRADEARRLRCDRSVPRGVG